MKKLFAILLVLALVAIPVAASAWSLGVSATGSCVGGVATWVVTANPEDYGVWKVNSVTGTGAGVFGASEAFHPYTVVVKWKHGNDYTTESQSGNIAKPLCVVPTNTPTPTATPTKTPTATPEPKKVYVCKYVGTPGDDERLQTGQNPIEVSVNAIGEDPVVVGSYFNDNQGRSFVLGFVPMVPEPNVDSCPAPVTPTPTNTPVTPTATATATTVVTEPPPTATDTPVVTEPPVTEPPDVTSTPTATSTPTVPKKVCTGGRIWVWELIDANGRHVFLRDLGYDGTYDSPGVAQQCFYFGCDFKAVTAWGSWVSKCDDAGGYAYWSTLPRYNGGGKCPLN